MTFKLSSLIVIDMLLTQAVGNTTSGCFSPVLGKGLVHAYVPAIVNVPGNQGGGGKRIEFTLKCSTLSRNRFPAIIGSIEMGLKVVPRLKNCSGKLGHKW